jgi:hypothetical protein
VPLFSWYAGAAGPAVLCDQRARPAAAYARRPDMQVDQLARLDGDLQRQSLP